MQNHELNLFRKKIDKTDQEVINQIARRMKIIDQVRKLKNECSLAIEDQVREKEVLNNAVQKGRNLCLSENFVRKLFALIIKESKRKQGS